MNDWLDEWLDELKPDFVPGDLLKGATVVMDDGTEKTLKAIEFHFIMSLNPFSIAEVLDIQVDKPKARKMILREATRIIEKGEAR